jgi:hypothetical protein
LAFNSRVKASLETPASQDQESETMPELKEKLPLEIIIKTVT